LLGGPRGADPRGGCGRAAGARAPPLHHQRAVFAGLARGNPAAVDAPPNNPSARADASGSGVRDGDDPLLPSGDLLGRLPSAALDSGFRDPDSVPLLEIRKSRDILNRIPLLRRLPGTGPLWSGAGTHMVGV